MRLFRFDDPEHGEAIELLPWLVNDTLNSGERAAVERHLAQCVACRNEVENLRALQAYIAQDDGDPLLTQALGRINARLEETESGSAPRRILRRIALQWRQTAAWLRGAVMAQAAAVLALLIVVLLAQPAPQYYRTLGASPVRASLDTELVVVFHAALPEREIRSLLLRLHARIVDGPSAAGAYTLEVAQGEQQLALAVLRREGSVIFAESAPQGARSGQ
jgi:putative zinc finger protein